MSHPVSIKGVLLLDGRVVREFAEELALEITVEEPLDSHLFEVLPGRHVQIVTYGCRLTGEFKPRLSDEHTQHCLWPLERLSQINLPAGYRRSVEKWASARQH